MKKENYEPMELFEKLKEDDSWENDPKMREIIAMVLFKLIRGK